MVKNNLKNLFGDLNSESSNISLKSIKIKDINSVDTISNTTSSFMPQNGGYLDATSSFMPQNGGYLDATSSFMQQNGGYLDATSSFMPQNGGYLDATKNKDKDIKQLISMLSATSENNYTTNSTDNTEQLKDKLLNILYGGTLPNEIKEIFSIMDLYKDSLLRKSETQILQFKTLLYDKIRILSDEMALLFLTKLETDYDIKTNLTSRLITNPHLITILAIIKYVEFKKDTDGMILQNKLITSIKNSIDEIVKTDTNKMDVLYENHMKEENNVKKEKLRKEYKDYFDYNFSRLESNNKSKIKELEKQADKEAYLNADKKTAKFSVGLPIDQTEAAKIKAAEEARKAAEEAEKIEAAEMKGLPAEVILNITTHKEIIVILQQDNIDITKLNEALSKIQILNLSKKNIGDKEVIALAEALKTNKTLRVINLNENNIGDDGFIALAEVLKTNKNVRYLYLEKNSILLNNKAANAFIFLLYDKKTELSINLKFNGIDAGSGPNSLFERIMYALIANYFIIGLELTNYGLFPSQLDEKIKDKTMINAKKYFEAQEYNMKFRR